MVEAPSQTKTMPKPPFEVGPDLLDTVALAYRLLGGEEYIKPSIDSSLDAHCAIIEGIPVQAYLYLIGEMSDPFCTEALIVFVGPSMATLQRRKNSRDKSHLSIEQGNRLWQFAEALARATDVFGDQETAEKWLISSALGLNNHRPIDLLATSSGASVVELHLKQLGYGVYV